MPNKNYQQGRRKEYKITKKLKENGFDIAQRSAGSHSPIDVFAIKRETKTIKFIQAKPDSMSESAKQKIFNENKWLNGLYEVKFEVI